MPGTANDYGLNSKDRFDFNSSTDVAIQLLNDLHQEFGNWALAFAAYNCGSQCVINALKKNPKATDIDELSLPTETKNYVHKIVQLNQLIAGLDNTNNKTH
jgi:membrane-bound lytic murein transglycosylase D